MVDRESQGVWSFGNSGLGAKTLSKMPYYRSTFHLRHLISSTVSLIVTREILLSRPAIATKLVFNARDQNIRLLAIDANKSHTYRQRKNTLLYLQCFAKYSRHQRDVSSLARFSKWSFHPELFPAIYPAILACITDTDLLLGHFVMQSLSCPTSPRLITGCQVA